jgi:hypothetical protein
MLTIFILACGGGRPTITQAPGGPTQPPAGTTQQPPLPGLGDNMSKARALVPPNSTEHSDSTAGSNVSIVVVTTQTLEQLGAFYQQQIPAAGMTETGRFTLGETLTISFTNPDGGIVAVVDPSQGVIVTISVGIQ